MVNELDAANVSDGWVRRRARIAFEIERAALHLFAVRSPDEVTVEEIAHAAGISRRTFFRYFPSRDDVLAALPMRHVARLCDRFETRPSEEGVLDAFIGAVIEEEAEGVEDELILLWGKAVLPSLPPEEDRVATTMVEAYSSVIAHRTGLAFDDPRVRVWATAISSTSAWAFLRWLEVGGNRSEILVESLVMLGELGGSSKKSPGPKAKSAASGSKRPTRRTASRS
jgi:AcrR family transcriptional regulator